MEKNLKNERLQKQLGLIQKQINKEDEYKNEENEYIETNKTLKKIGDIFPNAKFIVSFDINYLNDIVSTEPTITIHAMYGCYCHRNSLKKIDVFTITGSKITNRYIIEELIKQNFHPTCSHIYLEGFDKIKNTFNQYEMFLGS
jgi:hypothetical protein